MASVAGEIIPKGDFYSYEAKYVDENGADLVVPAALSSAQLKEVQELALKTFQVLEAAGLARVDFFYDSGGTLSGK
jgi:D-alanine-D-alanine ligase